MERSGPSAPVMNPRMHQYEAFFSERVAETARCALQCQLMQRGTCAFGQRIGQHPFAVIRPLPIEALQAGKQLMLQVVELGAQGVEASMVACAGPVFAMQPKERIVAVPSALARPGLKTRRTSPDPARRTTPVSWA